MATLLHDFRGTEVFADLSSAFVPWRAPFKKRFLPPFPSQPVRLSVRPWFLGHNELWIVSVKSQALIGNIVRRISQGQRRNAREAFLKQDGPNEMRYRLALGNFVQMERVMLNGRARHTSKKLDRARRILLEPKMLKLLKRLHSMGEIAKLRIQKRCSFQEISQHTGLAQNSVVHLWTSFRRTKGNALLALADKLTHNATRTSFLEGYFESLANDPVELSRTQNEQYQTMLRTKPRHLQIPFCVFYQAARRHGFRFRAIRYTPHVRTQPSRAHKAQFAHLLLYLAHNRRHFYLVFVDETAICESNFQRKQWRARNQSNVTPSRVRYERIEVLGALSADGMIAVQLIAEGLGADVFAGFACITIKAAFERCTPDQQVVVFLDNAPRHFSEQLQSFARQNRVVFLFNLPHMSALNPIEFAWELAKLPFR